MKGSSMLYSSPSTKDSTYKQWAGVGSALATAARAAAHIDAKDELQSLACGPINYVQGVAWHKCTAASR